jgi:hypothetical protein
MAAMIDYDEPYICIDGHVWPISTVRGSLAGLPVLQAAMHYRRRLLYQKVYRGLKLPYRRRSVEYAREQLIKAIEQWDR